MSTDRMTRLQVEVAPEEAGMSAGRLARLRTLLQGYIDAGKLAGVVALVARHGKVVSLESLGARDLEEADPMRPDSIFRIYSMTKPVTAVAALILYEEGRFQLDDPVARYIPEFRNVKVWTGEQGHGTVEPKRPVTVRDLFLHTAGIGMDPGASSPLGAYFRDARLEQDDLTLAEMVERRVRIPLFHHPGEGWSYGSSSDVLAYLVEVLSGQPFDEFLRERIFEPLGMEDTGFWVPPEKQHRLVTVYGPPRGGRLVALEANESPFTRPRRFLSGSAGLVSTAGDYFRFAEMLRRGGEWEGVRILGRKTVELMTSNHLPERLLPYRLPWRHLAHYTQGCGYGLGVRVVLDVAAWGLPGSAGEFGWAGANNTYFWVDPAEGITMLLFTQFQPFMHYALDRQFKVLTYQAILD